jgi:hypothetical protein
MLSFWCGRFAFDNLLTLMGLLTLGYCLNRDSADFSDFWDSKKTLS